MNVWAAGLPALAALVCASAASAQAAPSATEVGLVAGAFTDYPPAFAEDGCEVHVRTLAADARYWPAEILAIEGAAIVSGSVGGQQCFRAAPWPIGQPFERVVYDDEIAGASFFATTLAAVFEPFRGADLNPRARLAWGRMWSKRLPFWLVGGGLRYKLGRHAILFDLERWKLSIDATREVVIMPATGPIEIQSVEPVTFHEAPYLIRVGWTIAIGR